MDIAWLDSVKKTKTLKVFPGDGAAGGWSTVLDSAITEFNKISVANNLNVTFVRSSEAPSEDGPGGADIRFQIKPKGKVSFKAYGSLVEAELGKGAAKGLTTKHAIAYGSNPPQVFKTLISMLSPLTVGVGKKTREMGDNVRMALVVHEFVHACGLGDDNADLTRADVFTGIQFIQEGSTPDQDLLVAQDVKMPPIVVADATVRRIQALWK